MTLTNPFLAGIASDDWPALEGVLQDFEAAWKRGERPDLGGCLVGSGTNRLALLIELLHVDLEYRVAAGESACMQRYLERFPELEATPKIVVDLLLGEFLACDRRGAAPVVDSFIAPFTPYESDFRARLDSVRRGGTQVNSLDLTNQGIEIRPAGTPWQPEVPGHTILERIGRGGMGVVYLARHKALDRHVALKMLVAGAHAGEEELARFQIEAQAVARLDHPNIVNIYEIGEHQRLPYFSIEYCPGGSLDARLKQNPLAAGPAAELVETLARAMASAHEQGVIHRDLKPANVLLTLDGTPKITDFGLAKRVGADSGQTQTESIVGTPCYMAPEQAWGESKRVGPAADIYALGAILYDCLTGRPPFKGANTLETLDQVRSREPIPPRQLVASIPADLETICLKCLRKEPTKRYESAGALADDLKRWLTGKPIRARPVGRLERGFKWMKRNPVVSALLGSIVLLVISASIAIYVKYLDAKESEARAIANEKEARKQEGEAIRQATIAKDNEETANAALRDLKHNSALDKIQLAQAAFNSNNIPVAHERLDQVPPELRKWEWHYLKTHFTGGLCTLYGHTNQIECVAFSPDGSRIVTSSRDGTARVWSARAGLPLLELKGHTGAVTGAAFSPNGLQIVTGNTDGTARIWDARTGTTIHVLTGHKLQVLGVAISPDGTRIVTASGDHTAKVWDVKTGKRLFDLTGHTLDVNSASFSRDGTRIVTAAVDNTAKIWDAATGGHRFNLIGHTDIVNAASFSPDGTRIVTAANDNRAKLWDAETGACLFDLKGHTWAVTSAVFSPDGRRIVTGSYDTTAKVWDAHSGVALHDLKGHTSVVKCVAFSPDGTRIVTGSGDKTAKLWDARTGAPRLEIKGHMDFVSSVAISKDESRIVTASWDKTAKVWDARNATLLFELKGHTDRVNSAAIGSDPGAPGRIVTGSADKTAKVWDAQTGAFLFDLPGHSADVMCVAFSPDASRIVTGSKDKTARIWDAKTGKRLVEFKGHTESVNAATFGRDGVWVVTGSSDQSAKVWDPETGRLLFDLRGHALDVMCVGVSRDGTRIVTGGIDSVAKVWDANTGAFRFDLAGHTSAVLGVSFSPDGARIVTASQDTTGAGVARIWDARTGTPLLDLKGHTSYLRSLAFSPDGRRIVTAGTDRTAIVWEARSGPEALGFRGHSGFVLTASFNPAGTQIVTGGTDKMAKVWDARSGALLFELKGYSDIVNRATFNADGTRIVTESEEETKVWDARSGEELKGTPIPQDLKPRPTSPDGRYFIHFDGHQVTRIDLALTDEEREHRVFWARPRPDVHREEFDKAIKANYHFAASFHLDRLLACLPQDRQRLLAERSKLQGNDRLIEARTAVHSPTLAKVELGPAAFRALQWDAQALRLLGGLLIRDGKPADAVIFLKLAIVLRADERPPVEELLLALAHRNAKQPDEAAKWHAQAISWLDRYQPPLRVLTGGALPSQIDPRYDPFDWESWYECEVFRAAVAAGLK